MEFFPEMTVSQVEGEAIARGLYAIALCDGLHERELALIAELYPQAIPRADATPAATLGALEHAGVIEPAALAGLLPPGPHRELFVKTAWLLAWADGQVSPAERSKVGAYAHALEIDLAAQARLEAEVKDFLLRPLAGLANVDAVAAVAKKLGL